MILSINSKSKNIPINKFLKAGVLIALISTLSLADETAPKSDYFVDATIGLNHTPIERSDQSGNMDIKSISQSGYNLTLALGYVYSDNISFTTGYQRIQLDEIHMDNLYLETEYTFEKIASFTPYIGVSLGYSRLSWVKAPISGVIKSDEKSGSYLLGATAGVRYTLSDKLSLMANYQLELMNHSVSVTMDADKSELGHSLSDNINVGVRYSF